MSEGLDVLVLTRPISEDPGGFVYLQLNSPKKSGSLIDPLFLLANKPAKKLNFLYTPSTLRVCAPTTPSTSNLFFA